MRSVTVLWNYFEKKLYINTIPVLRKTAGFCTFSQEKVNFYSDMTETIPPPESVKGMKVLDRSAFKKLVTVPSLTVEKQHLSKCLKLLKNYLFKAHSKFQELSDVEKIIFLNPEKFGRWEDFDNEMQEKLRSLNIQEGNFKNRTVELGYENWKASELLKAILPKDEPPFSSYTQIGHIVHLNLKSYLIDYKQVIGEILLDKVKNAKTVVYKTNVIMNEFRTSDMEVICGEPNFMVSTKENQCLFEFDFSKVYWNPRLNTEHKRISNIINFGDVLFDVFAGVGPFAIPAAKKKCMVHANDLNPESYKWLEHSIGLNKKCKDFIKIYNKDGGCFILTDVKEQILKIWHDEFFCGNIHVVMNLPMLAPTFCKYFKGLIKEDDVPDKEVPLPIIHCYFFQMRAKEKDVFEKTSGMNLDGVEHSFHVVRGVSTSNEMIRVTFTLPRDYLIEKSVRDGSDEPLSKKTRTT